MWILGRLQFFGKAFVKYLTPLVRMGRQLRNDKCGVILKQLAPILERLHIGGRLDAIDGVVQPTLLAYRRETAVSAT
jgi:hypothetical protein